MLISKNINLVFIFSTYYLPTFSFHFISRLEFDNILYPNLQRSFWGDSIAIEIGCLGPDHLAFRCSTRYDPALSNPGLTIFPMHPLHSHSTDPLFSKSPLLRIFPGIPDVGLSVGLIVEEIVLSDGQRLVFYYDFKKHYFKYF